MELYYSEGQDMVKEIMDLGHDVFLDLKCHDIPHTVESAMRVLGKLGVSLTTLHASGGSEMMKAAKNGLLEGAQSNGKKAPKLLAITQLTSTSPEMAKKNSALPAIWPKASKATQNWHSKAGWTALSVQLGKLG